MISHHAYRRFLVSIIFAAFLFHVQLAGGQTSNLNIDWADVERETLEHFQALVRLNTANPPGNETRAVDYLQGVLEKQGIPVQRFAVENSRANLVARLKGNGTRRPLLLMGHTDVVTVEASRWTFPPFSATRDSGYIYGRGTLDDKDNLVGSLMMMLLLKRLNVPLDRDVILLAESGEEGTTRVGIELIVNQHFNEVAAEYCIAEGGGVRREGGKPVFASIGTLEKIPRAVELTARGPAGHASVPLQTNPVVHLARAIAAMAAWKTPVRLNETTREYFRRLADISSPEMAQRFRDVLSNDPRIVQSAVEYFESTAPAYAAILRNSVSPTIIQAGNRVNVIPSEAKATVDIRVLPDEDVSELLGAIRRVINDPAVSVEFAARDGSVRPPGGTSINTEAFRVIEGAVRKHYGVLAIPSMGTGATDSAFLRAKGIHCYGIGPATDAEDSLKGFGAHSDQERILESELYRFVRYYWDIVTGIAESK